MHKRPNPPHWLETHLAAKWRAIKILHDSHQVSITDRRKFVPLCEKGSKKPSHYKIEGGFTIKIETFPQVITAEKYEATTNKR